MIRKLSPQDYAVSSWSGGITTQIAIWPPEAKYADRDFLWRISSATVELEESDFTSLPDYDRLIATLEGEIVLTHNGGAPLTLRPFEVHAFSGADATRSRGRCRDFNLMLRRGKVTGTMETLRLSDTPTNLHAGTSIACPHPALSCSAGNLPADPAHVGTSIACPPNPPAEQILLYCVEGEATASPSCHSERGEAESKDPSSPSPLFPLAPGEALLLTDPVSLTLTGPAVLMLCRIRPSRLEEGPRVKKS
jgi:environmental stress-induced protein Ves